MHRERVVVDYFLVPPLQQRYAVCLSVGRIHYSEGWEILSVLLDLSERKSVLVDEVRDKDVAESSCEVGAVAQRFHFDEGYW